MVAHYTCRVTGEHPEMHMKLTPKAEVVVEKWGDFYNALEVIRLEVVEVLNAPEILAAVS
ncbi:MAG TPA: hypothetical protein VI409_02610 [Gaiellaceae bacterium]|nr:hypothetical protein [Gaiellaceae bacterium]